VLQTVVETFSHLEMTRARPTTAAPATTLRLFWAVTLAPVTTLRLVMALTLAPATVATARRMVRLYWMVKIWSTLPPRRGVLIWILQYGRSIGTLRSSSLELYTVQDLGRLGWHLRITRVILDPVAYTWSCSGLLLTIRKITL
jgi:hypothetical protein